MKQSQLRVTYKEHILSQSLQTPGESFNFLIKIWDKSLINIQEQTYMLFLNATNQVISWRCINTGTGSKTLFDIKFAMACALNCMASKVILAHNHPSGILKPSSGDIEITQKLNYAADLLDIKLVDHLIITRKNYYSFSDSDLIKQPFRNQ
ncbi:MAG: JAB domain-containing protein [Bacteroidetes bacterium]|nr:JAB domain-containing protein [Bacteroidota bacterium]